ncbi:MAG: endolytic transglycosylase MltG [Bacteroidia bacterium]
MAQKSRFKKIAISLLFIFFILGLISFFVIYKLIYKPNVSIGEKKSQIIYIPTGSNYENVVDTLKKNKLLKDPDSFYWVAKKKNYTNSVKPGKYRILANMNNNELVGLLRAGIQEPVEINFNGLHTVKEFMDRVGRRIEASPEQLYKMANDNQYTNKFGFNRENIQALFIPNTYQFYWNTSVDQFFNRMAKEYKLFWTADRKQKAKEMKFSQTDVVILASIVQAEQCCDNEEKRVIAGLYINRLNIGMPLQSDPTVIFAVGDFNIQRISYEQTRINSSYNTYINKGLPPGPIGFAQQSAIDAVLNYIPTNYVYMCAKDDLTGKHCFSKTFEQHQLNAKKYRNALDQRGIH